MRPLLLVARIGWWAHRQECVGKRKASHAGEVGRRARRYTGDAHAGASASDEGPGAIARPDFFYSVTVDGKEERATDVCERYVALTKAMLETYRAHVINAGDQGDAVTVDERRIDHSSAPAFEERTMVDAVDVNEGAKPETDDESVLTIFYWFDDETHDGENPCDGKTSTKSRGEP